MLGLARSFLSLGNLDSSRALTHPSHHKLSLEHGGYITRALPRLERHTQCDHNSIFLPHHISFNTFSVMAENTAQTLPSNPTFDAGQVNGHGAAVTHDARGKPRITTVSQVPSPPFEQLGNPGPLGLIGFAITTFVGGLYQCGAG